MPILATEASRAFVPPCTRAHRAGRLLSDQHFASEAGTLAANSPLTQQAACQPKTKEICAPSRATAQRRTRSA